MGIGFRGGSSACLLICADRLVRLSALIGRVRVLPSRDGTGYSFARSVIAPARRIGFEISVFVEPDPPRGRCAHAD